MKGLIHIYTGEGKGKTTAATGLALRAFGAGYKVMIAQLFKNETSEKTVLEKIGITYTQYTSKHPLFKKYSEKEIILEKKQCEEFIKKAFLIAKKEEYEMLIIDEIGPAIKSGFVTKEIIKELILEKPEKLELVLTGRGFPNEIITLADYANDIKSIAHPFNKGIKARKGIEY